MADPHQPAATNASSGAGWSALFWEAFKRSSNAMVLLDDQRRQVEVNRAYAELTGYERSALLGRPVFELVADGPILTNREWREVLQKTEFTGVAELICRNGDRIRVDFAGHPEVVTGKQLVLCVAVRATHRSRPPDNGAPEPSATISLSRRELEVIGLIALGLSGPEIAQELQLTHNTVRTHVRNAMIKSGARSRAHLVAKSLGEGVLWTAA